MAAKPKSSKKKPATIEDVSQIRQVIPPRRMKPQVFEMHRGSDETGVSGTGLVAEGIVFSNGKCVVEWLGAMPCTQMWPAPSGFDAFEKIHISSHPENGTEIRWLPLQEPKP